MDIVLADAKHVVREGVRLLLDGAPDMNVSASVADGACAIKEISHRHPDVAILDIPLPTLSGLGVIERVGREGATRFLILASRHSSTLVREALSVGACGYLTTSAQPRELLDAVRAAHGGGFYLCPEVAGYVVAAATGRDKGPRPGTESLSSREREVLKLIGEGLSSKEIAETLGISVRTADGHRARLMEKLSVHKMSGLIHTAIREGLVDI